ncbi:putative ribosomal N-acetyltransferase YdaF [Agromyces sp. NDB4Y10]|uniref:GNAT family N-acetyltransferase n=1 Tax=Agromyces sp. NDB4Y10 TaxID=1775951 RepID=UPI0007B2E148|nr:GNAT family N-acetyltransferase [Agromyces sp. NDB4Y10]KZE95270.1 putative ribosomal N-acetyltransferase YdaF [Agromyces sp. NDB4Y10]
MSRTEDGSPKRHAGFGDLVRAALPRRPRFMRGPRIADPLRAPVIRTERLLLRPHRLADAPTWYAWQSDPAVIEHLSWPLRTRAESYLHLMHRTRHTRLEQLNDFLALGVEYDGRLVGDVSLHLRSLEPETRRLEIGWLVGPEWQGRGFAREAAEGMLGLAFDRMHAATVVAIMTMGNEASHLLAVRLGFEEAGETDGDRVTVLTAERYRAMRGDRAAGDPATGEAATGDETIPPAA